MTKKWRRVYAWVLTVAMVLSMANLPITIAQAAFAPLPCVKLLIVIFTVMEVTLFEEIALFVFKASGMLKNISPI